MAEGVGAFVAEGGGVGRAAAADRVQDEQEGARHQAIRSWTSGPSSARRLVRGGRRRGRGRSAAASAGLVGGVDAGERRVGLDDGAEADQALEPDGVVDRVAGAAAAAAELDHGEAEAAGVDGGDEAVAVRRRRRRSSGAPARCASKPSRKSAGPPSAATMRSKRSAAAPDSKAIAHAVGARRPASAARPPSGEQLGAERHGHVPEPAVDDVAAQEAGGVRHLQRVAGGGGQRLVHVGDQRAGRAAGAVRHFDQARGQRAGVVAASP